jgi:hypothetical protein
MDPVLLDPYGSEFQWVKADMLYTMSLDRLSFPFCGKGDDGKRIYDVHILHAKDLLEIQKCLLHGLGLSALTLQLQ